MYKFSIVIAYYNRKDLLYPALDSINESKLASQTEVIIVDDASDDTHKLHGLEFDGYKFGIKLISINKDEKYWSNPCIPFNIGFDIAEGETIIIQNPETYHYGDVLEYIDNNFKSNEYYSFACYSMSKETTKKLLNKEAFSIVNRGASDQISDSWFNHPIYRPVYFHFLSVIDANVLKNMGGFDERYAEGIAYDDNEFLHRVKMRGLDIKLIADPFVIHLYHDTANTYKVETERKIQRNRNLFELVTKPSKEWKVNK